MAPAPPATYFGLAASLRGKLGCLQGKVKDVPTVFASSRMCYSPVEWSRRAKMQAKEAGKKKEAGKARLPQIMQLKRP